MQTCIFCKRKISSAIPRIREGGRVCFCNSCLTLLESKGYLRMHCDHTVTMDRPILDTIVNYPLL